MRCPVYLALTKALPVATTLDITRAQANEILADGSVDGCVVWTPCAPEQTMTMVVVFGGAGFLGRRLVYRLTAEGMSCTRRCAASRPGAD